MAKLIGHGGAVQNRMHCRNAEKGDASAFFCYVSGPTSRLPMPGDSPGSVLYKEQAKSGLERWRALAIWRPGIRCIQPDAGRYFCL